MKNTYMAFGRVLGALLFSSWCLAVTPESVDGVSVADGNSKSEVSIEKLDVDAHNAQFTKPKQLSIKAKYPLTSGQWSIHKKSGRGILQLTIPNVVSAGKELAKLKYLYTQAWLLNADGTASRASERKDGAGTTGDSDKWDQATSYDFAPDATASAIAVVIQVEKEFFAFSIKE